MALQSIPPIDRRKHDPELEHRLQNGLSKPIPHGRFRSIGLGLITGASDDDPAAIGTYAAVGASMGPSLLWSVPAIFPMMYTVVYLCSKLGQVTGEGLFAVIRQHYPRWLLYSILCCALVGNVIEAGADIGGMAAAMNLLLPIPGWITVIGITVIVCLLQIFGSYILIRNIFRWLALVLLAYVGAAFLAKPDWLGVLKATFVPQLKFDSHTLSMLVAIIGTTLSAYLYSWQSNQEVEEDISLGRRRLTDRMGTRREELRHSARDIAAGMFFASIVTYFIMLSTAYTLFKAGERDITTAAQAAGALVPIAGHAAGVLFAVGVISVGFLAVPIMTTGAAYDLCQAFGWKHGLHFPPGEVKRFNAAIAIFTALGMSLNFFGINPMKALVWSSIVQGVSTPLLMFLIMLITNNRKIMGRWVNTRALNVFGWITTVAIFAASAALIFSWIAGYFST
ncbi:MAG TPA: Nramp family divalent metal transporter [Terriglobales bacterium]|jgi:NRAMP (natural resistance-associated macrophage protein)-like metal ion transporter|nr:Nramp family divalent metal transporter [Terriglobales bacterium]